MSVENKMSRMIEVNVTGDQVVHRKNVITIGIMKRRVHTVVRDFTAKCTIPEMNRLSDETTSAIAKFAWVMLLFISSIVSFTLNFSMFFDFSRYSIVTTVAPHEMHEIPFPAITFCMQLSSKSDNLSSVSSEFIMDCEWHGTHKEKTLDIKDIYKFTSDEFGSCYTINPGFEGTTPLSVTIAEQLSCTVKMGNVAVYVVHHSGEPMTKSMYKRRSKLRPDHYHNVVISTAKYIRLPAPFPSKCLEKTSTERLHSSYYSEKSPYYYSYEVCLDEYNEELNKSTSSEKSTDHFTCSKLCESFEYTTIERVSQASLRNFLPLKIENCKDCTVIKFHLDSTVIKLNQEVPKMSLVTFVAAIGGNLGLWVGLSFICTVEFILFFITILQLVCKRRIKKKGLTARQLQK